LRTTPPKKGKKKKKKKPPFACATARTRGRSPIREGGRKEKKRKRKRKHPKKKKEGEKRKSNHKHLVGLFPAQAKKKKKKKERGVSAVRNCPIERPRGGKGGKEKKKEVTPAIFTKGASHAKKKERGGEKKALSKPA